MARCIHTFSLILILLAHMSAHIRAFVRPAGGLAVGVGVGVRAASRGAARHLSMKYRVTNYNVLSSHLAGADYFRNCDPKWLDEKHRLKKLKEKLDFETSQDAIINLQEVSIQWAGPLHSYFAKKGYQFVTASYGKSFNGYMGIATAIPLSKFNVEGVDITRVGDTFRLPRAPKPSKMKKFMMKYVVNPIRQIMKKLGKYKEQKEPFAEAVDRKNQMICARLEDKETKQQFCVGTYHMPCMFKLPQVYACLSVCPSVCLPVCVSV
jgi:mRNA deadenylase 3'-5' endonuclease subunit Ccr4